MEKNFHIEAAMDDNSFINNCGHDFNDGEQRLILAARNVIAKVTEIEAELIYPDDVLFDLCDKISRLVGCVAPDLVQAMEEQSFIDTYKVDLTKVKNPDFDESITVSEFINSILESVREQ